MSRLAFGALWLQVFLLPCELFLYMPEKVDFPQIGTLGRLAGLVALPLGILEVVRRGKLRPVTKFHVWLGLFVLWSWMTVFWSFEPEATYNRAWTYLQLAALTWLIWELASTPDRQRALLQAYVLGAWVAVLDTIGNFLSGTVVATGRFAATGFGPNDLGFTLVLALPLAWYLSLIHTSKLMRWVNLLYMPLGIVGILLTASRSSLISAFLALSIVPWTLSRHSGSVKWGFCLLLVLSGIAIQAFIPESSWTRLASATEEFETGSFNERDRIWQAGLQVFERHPIAGVGAGVFGIVVQPILGAPRAAHQTFLSVLVGQGLVGLTLFLAIFVAAFAPVRKLEPAQRAMWWVLLLTLAVGLQPRTWDYRKPLWFFLAVLAAQTSVVATSRSSRRIHAGPRNQSVWQDGDREQVELELRGGRAVWTSAQARTGLGPI